MKKITIIVLPLYFIFNSVGFSGPWLEAMAEMSTVLNKFTHLNKDILWNLLQIADKIKFGDYKNVYWGLKDYIDGNWSKYKSYGKNDFELSDQNFKEVRNSFLELLNLMRDEYRKTDTCSFIKNQVGEFPTDLTKEEKLKQIMEIINTKPYFRSYEDKHRIVPACYGIGFEVEGEVEGIGGG